MFGTREEFAYRLCPRCGCLQIESVPLDLGRFYKDNYYSFLANNKRGVLGLLQRERMHYAVFRRGFLGSFLFDVWPTPVFDFFGHIGESPKRSMRILDVGSGSGWMVNELRRLGFDACCGVDPFLPESIDCDGQVRIFNCALSEMPGHFDLVMFHHSLEHMADQHDALKQTRRLLEPGGICVVRVPLVSSEAWEIYGSNWVQLDAPRHLFLHSETSLRMLAEECLFDVVKVVYDSTEFQFWGSELYLKGVALANDKGVRRPLLRRRELKAMRQRALKLNSESRGDQAIFVLQRR